MSEKTATQVLIDAAHTSEINCREVSRISAELIRKRNESEEDE